MRISYSEGIHQAFCHLLDRYPEVFVVGQGLWSPWYVGNTMKDLDKKYGQDRVMDSPVSEDATTAIAAGASLCGYRPIVVHPRVDFMVLASNSLVNQIAKWNHMLGGQAAPKVTIRAIVNRGGEQGAQHSQALHSWFSHVPGLRVVMPATAEDARDLLVASVLCDDPVLYIDDRWCYECTSEVGAIPELRLEDVRPKILRSGADFTLVAAGYSTQLALQAASEMAAKGFECEVIDLRVLNPLQVEPILESVRKTGRLVAIDGSWRTCGMAGEIVARVFESVAPHEMKAAALRVTLADAPAPTSRALEKDYYPTVQSIVTAISRHFSTTLGVVGGDKGLSNQLQV